MRLEGPILSFRDVTVEANPRYDSSIWNVNFTLQPGDLLLVRLEEEHERLPLADAAEGLAPLLHGQVSFAREDWQEMSASHADVQRGRIGRVYEEESWVSSLSLEENILLAQLHHTQRGEAEILAEALNLAHVFGLPGLPRGWPSATRRQDLRKASCVRAFLGHPGLIILENPTRGIYPDIIAPLINLVQAARRRGAAVLWTTGEAQVWTTRDLRATWRCKMFGSQLHVLDPE